ncbi:hypothetical protein [Kitasatospora sp. NPDC056181]|uniref:hypothetical protein n=1 Tax=Kitasatospora sp. NPDC056181 TaxID=3345737 RepID=UPI0035D840CB
MVADGTWFVLVQEDYENHPEEGGAHWRLDVEQAARSLKEARETAEHLARTYRPGRSWGFARWSEQPRRSIYRLADGSFLVSLHDGLQKASFRVSLGELVEEITCTGPVSPPNWSEGRFFGRG